ncbi:anti-sigma regulatory factor (Ser/Thr protein kinase) [Streptomyces sp. V2I9]|nr:anti-sigma regulatory factor (Ser/Thr protein kinase) [Streptomyces sp. V2I9]
MSPADVCSPFPEVPGAGRNHLSVKTAADAREALAGLLTASPLHTPGVLMDAQLAVTELVSNASRHAGGLTGFDAYLDACGTRLVIVVEDADPRRPVGEPLALRDPTAPGGRGWALVLALADTSVIAPLPNGGKRIQITFALRGADASEG